MAKHGCPTTIKTRMERCLNAYMSSERLEPFDRASSELELQSGQGLPGHVWSSREPAWFLDSSSKFPQEFLRADVATQVGLKGGFAVPIVADNEVLAVLAFFMMSESRQEELNIAIEDLLNFSQLGRVAYELEPLSLNELVGEAGAKLAVQLEAKGVAVEVSAAQPARAG